MPALLIGIDPPKDIKKEIYKLKRRVIEVCGHQQQVNEPPHCTFIVNNFRNIRHIDNVLKSISADFSSFDVNVRGIGHFPLGKSETYVVCALLQKCNKLEKLQRLIVTRTSQYREGCLLQEYLQRNAQNCKFSKEELSNIKKFGFPYIGRNWRPHITVAILNHKCFKDIRNELVKFHVLYHFPLNEITLFRCKGGWQPFKKYKLTD